MSSEDQQKIAKKKIRRKKKEPRQKLRTLRDDLTKFELRKLKPEPGGSNCVALGGLTRRSLLKGKRKKRNI